MNRIEQTFKSLKAQKRTALITYLMAGDPDFDTSLDAALELAKHADILEIGMAFTDPMADGPVIQAAGLRALKKGITLKRTLEFVQQFRSKNSQTPIVLMGYLNPILAYGIDKFCNDCNMLGVDGLIIVDVSPEEEDEILPKAQQNNLCFIRLLTPTTDEARFQKIVRGASGFLYYVAIAGITGTASADPKIVGARIAAMKLKTDLPIVTGFGIKTPCDAAAMSNVADGVVVGSALVQTIALHAGSPTFLQKIGEQAGALAESVHTRKVPDNSICLLKSGA